MNKSKKRKGAKDKPPYSAAGLEKALLEVRKGQTIRGASKSFNVPYATLQSRVTGVYPVSVRPGPSSVFSQEEEKELVNWILHMGKCGFPVTREQLLDCVQSLVKKQNKTTPFKNGRPSKKWYKSFLKRNSELSVRMCQNLTKRRANVTEQAIRAWFAEVEDYLKSKDNLTPKSDKVLVRRGEKAPYIIVGSDKEYYTALIGGNAAGQLIPTMIVYNNERISSQVAQNFPDEFVIGKSCTGWMTTETFHMYIVNYLYPWCVQNGIPFPIILYVDGHSSHINLELSRFCADHNIELICLYPNATHVMQPMDVALFRPLKAAYKDSVRSWRLENDGQALTKVFFAGVLNSALKSVDIKKIFENGFRRCELSPFSADGINYNRLISTSESSVNQTSEVSGRSRNSTAPQDGSYFFESNIAPDILQAFKEASNNSDKWIGPLEYKALYDLWYKCKNKTNSQSQNQDENFSSTTQVIENNNIQSEMFTDYDTTIIENSDLSSAKNINNVSQEEVRFAEIYFDESAMDRISNDEKITSNNISIDELHNMSMLLDDETIDNMDIVHVVSDDSSLSNLHIKSLILDKIDDSSSYLNHSDDTRIDESIKDQHTSIVLIESTPNDSGFVEPVYDQNITTEDCSIINVSSKDFMKNDSVSSIDKKDNFETPLDLRIVSQSTFKYASIIVTPEGLDKEAILSKCTNIHNENCSENMENVSPNIYESSNSPKQSTVPNDSCLNNSKVYSNTDFKNSAVESPFKQYLYYPESNKDGKQNGKRKPKEKLPFVATGPEWRAWYESKAKQKEEEEKKKADMKRKKLENIEAKKECQESLKKIKLEKIDTQTRLEELDLKIQRNRAKLRLFKVELKSEHVEEKQLLLKKKLTIWTMKLQMTYH